MTFLASTEVVLLCLCILLYLNVLHEFFEAFLFSLMGGITICSFLKMKPSSAVNVSLTSQYSLRSSSQSFLLVGHPDLILDCNLLNSFMVAVLFLLVSVY